MSSANLLIIPAGDDQSDGALGRMNWLTFFYTFNQMVKDMENEGGVAIHDIICQLLPTPARIALGLAGDYVDQALEIPALNASREAHERRRTQQANIGKCLATLRKAADKAHVTMTLRAMHPAGTVNIHNATAPQLFAAYHSVFGTLQGEDVQKLKKKLEALDFTTKSVQKTIDLRNEIYDTLAQGGQDVRPTEQLAAEMHAAMQVPHLRDTAKVFKRDNRDIADAAMVERFRVLLTNTDQTTSKADISEYFAPPESAAAAVDKKDTVKADLAELTALVKGLMKAQGGNGKGNNRGQGNSSGNANSGNLKCKEHPDATSHTYEFCRKNPANADVDIKELKKRERAARNN